MGVVRKGPANPNWKGGRSIASNGYVLIRIGTEHHLADVRGYAYEHRIVLLEAKLGRRLRPGEDVHHKDENIQNNHPDNLEPKTKAWHRFEHRKPRQHALRRPDEPNVTVSCACGCSAKLQKYDASGRPRRFVSGHNIHPRRSTNG